MIQVLFDFDHRFETAKGDALVGNWKYMAIALSTHLNEHHKVKLITDWCPEIHEILVLLRLFPDKSVGRNLGTIANFNRAADKLFVFREVYTLFIYMEFRIINESRIVGRTALNALVNKGSKFPYIIAVGEDKSNISKYYIDFEKHLFDVSSIFTSIFHNF